jgi:non-ribosomal peptide synthetase component F
LNTILGVLKTGNFYVPLDPRYPKARNGYILENSRASLLLTDYQNLSLARELIRGEVRLIRADAVDGAPSEKNLTLPVSPDAFAYIVYTSGSTGQPKGVLQNHRNVLHEVIPIAGACARMISWLFSILLVPVAWLGISSAPCSTVRACIRSMSKRRDWTI